MSLTVSPLRQPQPSDYGLMTLTALIWASAFVAIRFAVPETGPLWLAAIRVGLGFLVLLPYALWRGFIFPQSCRQWALICAMSLLNMVIPFTLIAWAGKTVEAGTLSLLMGTGPFLALTGSHFLTADDRMTRRKLLGVVIGFTGILVVVGPNAIAGLGTGSVSGIAAALGASLCYVMAGLFIRMIDMPPVRLACLALGLGSAVLIPSAFLFAEAPPTNISGNAWIALFFLGFFPTGLAYILRFTLIRAIGYSRFALAVNMIPVFGVILGVVLLGEALSVYILLALALVVAGLLVAGSERNG